MAETKTELEEQTPRVSAKRQVTAVVASTAVTVVLGVAAQALISKVASRVQDRINPKTEDDE